MASKRKEKISLLLYYDYIDQFEMLDDSQFRKLIYSMIEFDRDGKEPELDKVSSMAFAFIKKRLILDKEKWKDQCNKNKENIEKRWNKNKEKNDSIQPNTTEYECIRKDTKYTDIDIEIEKDIEKDIEIESVCVINNTPPHTHTEVFQFCKSIFQNFNYDENDLKKSCKKFFNYYKEKNWQGVNDWHEKLEIWIDDDIENGKIKKQEDEDEYYDEAGFLHRNGRRIL